MGIRTDGAPYAARPLSVPPLDAWLTPASPGLMRRSLETALVLAAAWGASRGLGWQVPGLDPLALAVALLASRNGCAQGVLAGALAGGVVLGEHHAGLQTVFALFGDRSALAASSLFPLMGASLGLIGDSHVHRAERLDTERLETESQLKALEERHAVLVQAKETQDRWLVAQTQTLHSLYEAARELETEEPDRVPPAALRLTAHLLEAEALSCYVVEDGELVLREFVGEEPRRQPTLPLEGSVLGDALRAGETLTVKTQEAYQRSHQLLGAALRYPDGRLRGALVIERMPFLKLTPDSVQQLELVADWASRAWALAESRTGDRA